MKMIMKIKNIRLMNNNTYNNGVSPIINLISL